MVLPKFKNNGVIDQSTFDFLIEPFRKLSQKRNETCTQNTERILATIGTLGMAGSGLLWNFQGLAFGLTGTLTASVALLLSLVFLWPLGSTKLTGQGDTSSVAIKPIKVEAVSQNSTPTPTTAEAIAEVLAAEQTESSEPTLVNYAPLHLLPGQRLSTRARRGGSSLGRYRLMAKDLFRS